jgi:CsoR family transcriptional regulator, copper-sensing transcriptional repressor
MTKHPDHSSSLSRLKKIKGQISGIEKMIDDQRYCVDILTQFRAVMAGLSAIEKSILQRHVKGCVKSAIQSRSDAIINRKADEIVRLIGRRLF